MVQPELNLQPTPNLLTQGFFGKPVLHSISVLTKWLQINKVLLRFVYWPSRHQCFCGNRTLWTLDTSDPRHFGTILVGPNCPDNSALVPKCPKDRSDLSAELSSSKCQVLCFLPHVFADCGTAVTRP